MKTWPKWAQRHIVLGLDLQGGSHLLLEVDASAVKKEKLNQVLDDARRVLREARIRFSGLSVRGDVVEVRVTDAARGRERAGQAARTVAAARRTAGLQRPAQPRGAGRRRWPDPPDGAAGRHHRAHPSVGRAVDPDHRAARQRTRHGRAADPAPGHRPHSGAGAGPAGSDATEGTAGQDRQDGLPDGRYQHFSRTRRSRGACRRSRNCC